MMTKDGATYILKQWKVAASVAIAALTVRRENSTVAIGFDIASVS